MRHPHTEKHTRHRRHHSILHTSLLTQLQMNVCIVVMNRCCLQMMTMMIDDERMKTLFWRQRLLRTMCLTLTCCLHRTQLTSKQHDTINYSNLEVQHNNKHASTCSVGGVCVCDR